MQCERTDRPLKAQASVQSRVLDALDRAGASICYGIRRMVCLAFLGLAGVSCSNSNFISLDAASDSSSKDVSSPSPIPCKASSDCIPGFCMVGHCVAKNDAQGSYTQVCEFIPGPDGISCNDGHICTTGDRCEAGQCKGDLVECPDDGNPCTAEICNENFAGCYPPDPEAFCNDNNACTENDRCNPEGDCHGTIMDCDDENPCTLDVCNESVGCTTIPGKNGAPCDDGNPCTTDTHCGAGECKGGDTIFSSSPCMTMQSQSGICSKVYDPTTEGESCDPEWVGYGDAKFTGIVDIDSICLPLAQAIQKGKYKNPFVHGTCAEVFDPNTQASIGGCIATDAACSEGDNPCVTSKYKAAFAYPDCDVLGILRQKTWVLKKGTFVPVYLTPCEGEGCNDPETCLVDKASPGSSCYNNDGEKGQCNPQGECK